jgi:hypothetical protein
MVYCRLITAFFLVSFLLGEAKAVPILDADAEDLFEGCILACGIADDGTCKERCISSVSKVTYCELCFFKELKPDIPVGKTDPTQVESHKAVSDLHVEAESRVKRFGSEIQSRLSGVRDLQELGIEALQRRLQQKEQEKVSGNAAEEEALSHDRMLLQHAMQALESGNKFSRKDAERARDPVARSSLELVAEASEIEHQLLKERTSALRTTAAFRKAARESLQNVGRMDSLTQQGSVGTHGAGSAVSPAKGPAGTEEEAATEQAGRPKTVHAGESDIQAPTTTAVPRKDMTAEDLRKQLREKLSRQKGGTELDADLASAGTGTEGGEASGVSSMDFSGLRDAFALADSLQQSQTGLGELEGEVKRLLAQAEGELLGAAQGVLPPESDSLFKRVKESHDSCVRKRCVRLQGTN